MSQHRTVWTCPRHCGIASGALMSPQGTLALGSSVAMSAPCSSWTNLPKLLARTGLPEQILVPAAPAVALA